MRVPDSVRLAVGLLTVVPVGSIRAPDRKTAARAMFWVLPVGALLGVASACVLVGAERLGLEKLSASVLAVASLAALTRGLHLDGLADTADGLGSRRPAAEALAVMRASDIGPFGVSALVLVLLLQVATLRETSWLALLVAVVIGRLSILACCLRGVPAARGEGLGALVAGSVPPPLLGVATAVVWIAAGALAGWGGLLAGAAAMVVTVALVWHCIRRLGGITGDVIGAAVELSTTLALLGLALD